MIFEKSSEIMRLFIAREALDPHLKVGGAIFNTQLAMSERVKAVFSSGKFYAGWYPRQWLPNGAGKIDNLHETLLGHVNYAARTSKRLARGLFHAMARFGPNWIGSNCSFQDLSGSQRNCSRSARHVPTRNGCLARVNRPMKFLRSQIISAAPRE